MKQKDRSIFNIDVHSVLQKFLSVVKLMSNQQKSRTHCYHEQDIVLDPIKENPNHAHITARGKGVKIGDCISIRSTTNGADQLYQVNGIDYYSNPWDIFIAWVEKV